MKDNQEIKGKLEFAFDVGHSSIGWAVLGETGDPEQEVELLGCGTVIFRADETAYRVIGCHDSGAT